MAPGGRCLAGGPRDAARLLSVAVARNISLAGDDDSSAASQLPRYPIRSIHSGFACFDRLSDLPNALANAVTISIRLRRCIDHHVCGTAADGPDSMTDSEKLTFLVAKISTLCTELDETKNQVAAISTRLDGHAARIARTE